MVKLGKVKEEKYDDWQVEDALSTLKKAEEIRADSKLMKLLAPKLNKQITSLEELRSKIKEKKMEESEEKE